MEEGCVISFINSTESLEVVFTSSTSKDSWQYVKRPEEGELIKEATDIGVQNIARYYHQLPGNER